MIQEFNLEAARPLHAAPFFGDFRSYAIEGERFGSSFQPGPFAGCEECAYDCTEQAAGAGNLCQNRMTVADNIGRAAIRDDILLAGDDHHTLELQRGFYSQSGHIAVTGSGIHAFDAPALADDMGHFCDIAAQRGYLHMADQLMCNFGAVSSGSSAYGVQHDRHVMAVRSLACQQHGFNGVIIQCADIQHYSARHGGDIRNFLMRISHKR
ncbi:hypothetical protein D3C81_1544070 [compost metagenome]